MKEFKNLALLFSAVAWVACENATVEGSWVEPVPGMPGMQQGVTLKADGSASSVNMATLKYEKWEKQGDLLLLSGVSIGNRQQAAFTDTLTVRKLTQDSLILQKGDLILRYAKADGASGEKEVIPASVITPAKKRFSVKGELVIGHEVRAFVAEGDSADYWITDETGELVQRYDEVTKGVKNGTPVYVELEVVDMGKSDDGFAAEYTSVYQALKINKMAPVEP